MSKTLTQELKDWDAELKASTRAQLIASPAIAPFLESNKVDPETLKAVASRYGISPQRLRRWIKVAKGA